MSRRNKGKQPQRKQLKPEVNEFEAEFKFSHQVEIPQDESLPEGSLSDQIQNCPTADYSGDSTNRKASFDQDLNVSYRSENTVDQSYLQDEDEEETGTVSTSRSGPAKKPRRKPQKGTSTNNKKDEACCNGGCVVF